MSATSIQYLISEYVQSSRYHVPTLNRLFDTFKDVWHYVKATRNIVIALIIAILLLFGVVVIMTESSAILPYIYTMF